MMYENNDFALSGRNGGDVPFYPNAMRWAGIFRAFSLSPWYDSYGVLGWGGTPSSPSCASLARGYPSYTPSGVLLCCLNTSFWLYFFNKTTLVAENKPNNSKPYYCYWGCFVGRIRWKWGEVRGIFFLIIATEVVLLGKLGENEV